jgi:hypothetical protein
MTYTAQPASRVVVPSEGSCTVRAANSGFGLPESPAEHNWTSLGKDQSHTGWARVPTSNYSIEESSDLPRRQGPEGRP